MTSIADMRETPLSDTVYQDCPHEIAVVIILLYVDNTGIRSNCPHLVKKFHADARANGKRLALYGCFQLVLGSVIFIWR